MEVEVLINTLTSSDVYKKVVELQGNPDQVISEGYPKWGRYKDATQVSFATAALNEWVRKNSGEEIAAIIVAGKDRAGSKAPATYVAITKDQKFLKFSSFEDGMLAPETKILSVSQYNDKYDNYIVQAVKSTEPLPNIAEKLIRVAANVSDGAACDKALRPFDVGDKNTGKPRIEPVVIVRGMIHWVNELQNKTWDNDSRAFIEHDPFDVLTDGNPTFAFTLDGNDPEIVCQITPGNKMHASIVIDDIIPLCEDAIEAHPGAPSEQAKYLRNGLQRDVIVVGVVKSRSSFNGKNRAYVDVIGVYETYGIEKPQSTLTTTGPSPDSTPEKEKPQKPKGDPLKASIVELAKGLKVWPISMNVDDVRKTLEVPAKTSDNILKITIDAAQETLASEGWKP